MILTKTCPDIAQDTISYFGSGESILTLSENDLRIIKEKTFVCTTNYGFKFIPCHLNIHSDIKVTDFIVDYLHDNKKNFLILSRSEAFNSTNNIHESIVDYWFNSHRLAKSCYSVVWMLDWLSKNYADKRILLFGFDMYGNEKFYDSKTDYDLIKRGKNYNITSKLASCAKHLEQIKNKNIFNCNPQSSLVLYPKITWQSALNL